MAEVALAIFESRDSAKPCPAWRYKPLLTPETEDEKAAVAKVTQDAAEDIAQNLQQKWVSEVNTAPVNLRSCMPQEPPLEFLKEVYFGLVSMAVQAVPFAVRFWYQNYPQYAAQNG